MSTSEYWGEIQPLLQSFKRKVVVAVNWVQVSVGGVWVVDLGSSWRREKWPKCCTFVKEIVFVSRAGTISLKQRFSIATERWVPIFISPFLFSLFKMKCCQSYRIKPGGWHFMSLQLRTDKIFVCFLKIFIPCFSLFLSAQLLTRRRRQRNLRGFLTLKCSKYFNLSLLSSSSSQCN